MSVQTIPAHPKVLSVKHWNDGLFSFTIERPPTFKFEAGQFVMIGMPGAVNDKGKPIMRAYSIASPPWSDTIEFLSIAVADGPLTSKLKDIKEGDEILLGGKATGTLVHSALTPGKNLYLMGTGTGLAPWMSIVQDPETYARFDHVYVCHGVREVKDLAHREFLEKGIFEDALLNEVVDGGLKGRVQYYPTTTREAFYHQGRLTDLIRNGKLFKDLGLSQTQFNPKTDRVMVCGNEYFNAEIKDICASQGLDEGATNHPGAFVVEKAFVEDKKQAAAQMPTPTPMVTDAASSLMQDKSTGQGK